MFWFEAGAVNRWRRFLELASTADNANGTANLVTDTEYRDGLTIHGEYQDANGDWIRCTPQQTLTAGSGAVTLVTESNNPGVGTWAFRLRAYTDDCDYGTTNELTQAIT
jgi:hypothetical protein